MADTHPRTDVQLLEVTRHEPGPTVVALDPEYTCSMCGSAWTYQVVRNTGRCPTCGSGLRRDGDRR